MWITFSYLWLPFAILPIFGALERLPDSLLEASSDLGARNSLTFRRVVFPLAFPGIVAASIFTFALTLGDYITPTLVGNGFFIGNVIYNLVGLASNLPLAAAFTMIPVAIMVIYLSVARKPRRVRGALGRWSPGSRGSSSRQGRVSRCSSCTRRS